MRRSLPTSIREPKAEPSGLGRAPRDELGGTVTRPSSWGRLRARSGAARSSRFVGGVVALVLTALAADSSAAPAIGVVVARDGAALPDGVEAAFRRGAAETDEGIASGLRAPPRTPADRRRITDAANSLELGEAAYLDLRLRVAERRLADAVDGFFANPRALDDAAPPVRAALLLAEVYLMLERPQAAERVLARGLRAVPGFPLEDSAPPPNVGERLGRLRLALAEELDARLEVVTEPPGLPVRVNGAALGLSPVLIEGLSPDSFRVTVEAADGHVLERLVQLSPGRVGVRFAERPSEIRDSLRGAMTVGHSARTWATALRLQETLGADATCVALRDTEGVIVTRIEGRRRTLIGAHAGPVPVRVEDWQALGRFCSADAPSNIDLAIAEERMWPSFGTGGDDGRDSFDRRTLAWTAVAAGMTAAGIGTWFGLSALSAQDEFSAADNPGTSRDASDRATANALGADVSFAVAAALIATGVYLLYDDSDSVDTAIGGADGR